MTDSEEDELSDSEHDEQQRPEDKLYILLERIDRLRQGTESDKRESLDILLEHREEVRNPPRHLFYFGKQQITLSSYLIWLQFGQNSAFLWRLMRAYSDVHDISSTLEEKKTHAERGDPNPGVNIKSKQQRVP